MDHTTLDMPNVDSADIIRLQQDWSAQRGATPLAQVEAYWYATRGTRLVPKRSDVDPRGIEGALSQACIIERIAHGHARIRIAGTHFTDLMGMEVRGMPLSALFEPVSRDKLQGAIRDLFDGPCIQKIALQSPKRIGKPALKAQLALYPLRNDLGEISRALGCIVSEGEIGRAPRRFEIAHTRRTKLTEDQAALEAPQVQQAEARPDRLFESGGSPLVAAAAEPSIAFKSTAVPWLRVVQDADDVEDGTGAH